ncbi:hypothetical protein SFRURICE_005315 [Spodoptera frugiperda]|nr:hypothetical protein SFRURICE_005315 [Spodoptera frugiperda]
MVKSGKSLYSGITSRNMHFCLVISPTTNTCLNTLPYFYDVHSWAKYTSYFVIMFKYVLEKNFSARPIPSRTIELQWGNGWMIWFSGVIIIGTGVQLHGKRGVQNLMLVDFYTKSLVYAEGIGRTLKFFSETYLNIMTK